MQSFAAFVKRTIMFPSSHLCSHVLESKEARVKDQVSFLVGQISALKELQRQSSSEDDRECPCVPGHKAGELQTKKLHLVGSRAGHCQGGDLFASMQAHSHTQNSRFLCPTEFLQNMLQITEAAKTVGLERKTGRKDPPCKSSICIEGIVSICLFFPNISEYTLFQNYCIVTPANENLWDLDCLFKEKVQADPLKTLDNFGSVICRLRESVFTDE